jgi:hypothetical protein
MDQNVISTWQRVVICVVGWLGGFGPSAQAGGPDVRPAARTFGWRQAERGLALGAIAFPPRCCDS